ncbi:AraC family transcriptional regulator [Clostridium oryzae]|uniref:Right origin-binding protein n=1 Tax=Clostridium oryzae TaxID=1450648 RepID=A0A1V4IFC7_9CLOT|nr:helix-turn-helix domain-containing protein [Clostridium oryzae]OPJ58554.1 right origin-binding protein [Clostridium oryzae]
MVSNIKDAVIWCINYIEDNLHNKLTLDDIYVNTGISKFYLSRMFKSLTGESVMEYVQARKLTSSIDELVNTNKRIIDIAMDYGFDYEQSYIRAFKKLFGCTPLKVRAPKNFFGLEIKEKINPSDLLCIDNSITYKPRFVFLKNFCLVGEKHKIISRFGTKAANSFGREFFYKHKKKINNIVNPEAYFGYTDWSNSNNGYIYYMPSVQVSDLSQVPDGMTGIEIKSNKYVVFKFVGFFNPNEISGKHLARLLVQLYRRWIVDSDYEFAGTYRLEYIDNSMCKDNYCELYICQPIK